MPPAIIRFRAGGQYVDLTIPDVAPGGDYSGVDYTPRYTLPSGVTYNGATGVTQGYPFSISYTESGNTVTLTQQGSRAANRALLQTTVTNAGTDAVTIICAPGAHDWGDEILIPGVTRTGVGMTIRGGTLPRAEGKRFQIGDAASVAQMRIDRRESWGTSQLPAGNQSYRMAFRIGHGATKVRLAGWDVSLDPTMNGSEHPAYNAGGLMGGSGLIGNEANGTLVYPDTIIVDRCYIHGVTGKATQRGVFLNGQKIALINSLIDDIHYSSADSQGFLAIEGGSGYVLENNQIDVAYGENFMFGGGSDLYDGSGDPLLARTCSDVVVRRNRFRFPAAYVALGYLTKNLSEFKGTIRTVYEGNILDGFTIDNGILGSQFFAFVSKFSTMAAIDHTYRLNHIKNSTGGILVEGSLRCDMNHMFYDPRGVTPIAGDVGYAMSVAEVVIATLPRIPDGLSLRRCTIGKKPAPSPVNARAILSQATRRHDWQVTGSILEQEDYPAVDGSQNGYLSRSGGALNAATVWGEVSNTGSTWTGNAISGVFTPAALIAGDVRATTKAGLGLNSDYTTVAASLADGKGCDMTLLAAATSGVETGL